MIAATSDLVATASAGFRRPEPPARARLDLRERARARREALLPTIDAGGLRDAAVGTWRARMVNEHGSARVFEALAVHLERAGFPAGDVATVREFADEERRHGELCGAVVEALGGEAVALGLPDAEYPWHEDAGDDREAVLRNVLSIGCLSETVAVALIGVERYEMEEGPLRDLLTDLWADEVGHARFGWRFASEHAPGLDEAARRRTGAYLAVAFAHLEAHELAHLPLSAVPPPEGARYGLCHGGDARALFYDTVTRVIVPGLERLGLPAAAAWDARHDA